MEKQLKCPFDKNCEECIWNTKMYEHNNEGEVTEVYKCAIAWTPILLSEIKLEIQKLKDNGTT